jgi:type III pantothenate kinase
MILTVDIGNSRIKWASWMVEKIVARGVARYDEKGLSETFDELFSTVLRPAEVYALCVAGKEMQQALTEWVRSNWQQDVTFLRTEKKYKNITNAYKKPALHGVDRWAAVVAGFQSCPDAAVCVIGAGTAITFDFIKKNGQHLGGYILPSYFSMHKSLLSDTANLKSRPAVKSVKQGVPNNTDDAVNQGLHKLLQAGIRDICESVGSQFDEPMQILITGGFAKTILSYPDMPVMQYKPDLVMQGLYNIIKQR